VELEKLAMLGIAVFVFMAAVSFYGFLRSMKRTAAQAKVPQQRIRRLIGGDDSALAVAQSVIREVAQKYPEAVQRCIGKLVVDTELEEPLAEARQYFLSRVEHRHRVLFNQVVDEIILEIEPRDRENT